MSKIRPPYPAEFRQQMVGLVRAGRAASPLRNRSHRHTHKRLMHKGFCVYQCAEVGAGFGGRESRE